MEGGWGGKEGRGGGNKCGEGWGKKGTWCITRLESWNLDSNKFARPMACVIELGWRTAISLRMSGMRPEMKQFRIISGVRPKTRLQIFSKTF